MVKILVEIDCYNEEVMKIFLDELEGFIESVIPEKMPYEEEVVEVNRVMRVIQN